ncbi:MAG: RNA pseudouridine synthase [Verrucomicrobia bacterium]|nr:RNA pseudouridine synthase [Verrucomicrobiota bacterium]
MVDELKVSWPLGPGVKVVKAGPAGLYALAKPGGVRSQPKEGGKDPGALLTCSYSLKDEAYHIPPDKGGGKVWLLHRLDAGTSGVILVADQERTAEEVKQSFAKHRVKKKYVAMVFGKPNESSAIWRDKIQVTKEGGVARGRVGQGQTAEARMRLRQSGAGPMGVLSLLELEPKTGRTHQLRIQCAQRGLPIVGDRTYGDFQKNRAFAEKKGGPDLFLHAESIEIPVFGNSFQALVPLDQRFKI